MSARGNDIGPDTPGGFLYPATAFPVHNFGAPVYLTGVTNRPTEREAHSLGTFGSIGLLVQPDSYGPNVTPWWGAWAADNGCFAKGEAFDADAWLRWLDSWPAEERARCLFAVAPDVVGNMAATLERSAPYLARIRSLGYRAALVAQDGAEDIALPWNDFDALFIGGSTAWKLSAEACLVVAQAHLAGKWVHMGRVNSLRRYRMAAMWGCKSVDGTYLAFGPTVNLPRLLRWIDTVQNELYAADPNDEPRDDGPQLALPFGDVA